MSNSKLIHFYIFIKLYFLRTSTPYVSDFMSFKVKALPSLQLLIIKFINQFHARATGL